MVEMAELIKAALDKTGWSRSALADDLGVNVRTLRRWERGDGNPRRVWEARPALEELAVRGSRSGSFGSAALGYGPRR